MDNFLPPQAKRVLVISPHPDDEALSCAGTMSLYASDGVEVYAAYVTNGEKSEIRIENKAEVRKREAISAATLIGVKETFFMEFPDEGVALYNDKIKENIETIVKQIEPDLILAPYPLDPHPDHKATSKIVLSVMRDIQSFRLAFYEVYHPIRFNILVDIASVIPKKKEAIFSYRKSLLDMPEIFWHSIEGLNRYRSLVYRRKSFYEVFWLIESPVSEEEIIEWDTFDAEIPAMIFLSKLKAADRLIHELHTAHASIEEKNAIILGLANKLSHMESNLAHRDKQIEALISENRELQKQLFELQEQLVTIQDSLLWKCVRHFYRVRDFMFPEGTARRNVYTRLVKEIKKKT